MKTCRKNRNFEIQLHVKVFNMMRIQTFWRNEQGLKGLPGKMVPCWAADLKLQLPMKSQMSCSSGRLWTPHSGLDLSYVCTRAAFRARDGPQEVMWLRTRVHRLDSWRRSSFVTVPLGNNRKFVPPCWCVQGLRLTLSSGWCPREKSPTMTVNTPWSLTGPEQGGDIVIDSWTLILINPTPEWRHEKTGNTQCGGHLCLGLQTLDCPKLLKDVSSGSDGSNREDFLIDDDLSSWEVDPVKVFKGRNMSNKERQWSTHKPPVLQAAEGFSCNPCVSADGLSPTVSGETSSADVQQGKIFLHSARTPSSGRRGSGWWQWIELIADLLTVHGKRTLSASVT